MVASKVNEADAQEWLASLQQVGEGWYRGVALAVRAGAPKALGITPREFAQQIGQRLIDPTQAIIELAGELKNTRGAARGKPNIQGIADVLGTSVQTVEMVLAGAGLIEVTPRRQLQLDTGKAKPRNVPHTAAGEDSNVPHSAPTPDAKLQAQVNKLTAQLAQAEGAAAASERDLAEERQAAKALRKDYNAVRKQLSTVAVAVREEVEAEITDQERARLMKEAEAAVGETREQILAGLDFLFVKPITGALEDAAEAVRQLVAKRGGAGIAHEHLQAIEAAHAAFIDELNVARMHESAVH